MSPADLVLASRNHGKIRELRRILADAGVPVNLRGSDEFDVPDVEETGLTFADNALLKARTIATLTGLPAIADDSGLCVDALSGMPGFLSARWAGAHGDDDANLDLVLAQISGIPEEHRGAHFACAAAVALPDGRAEVVEGTIEGVLLRERRGSGGFGYDPIFVPAGHDRTTAEMSAEEKDAISHRGKAFRALAPRISQLLGL